MATAIPAVPPLAVRLLGELTVERGGTPVPLPPSRKTRALLAYLVVTGRPHRRDRLCDLLWDVTEDPRGALRWSLSRLRADRESVEFAADEALVDVLALRARYGDGIDGHGAGALRAAASQFRGEFLEGLDLPDFHDFQSWCVAEREAIRRLQARILAGLVGQLRGDPEAALPYARELTQVAPFDEGARVELLRLLAALGRMREAEECYRAAGRLFTELGHRASGELLAAWQALRGGAPGTAPGPAVMPEASHPGVAPEPALVGDRPLVGRERERASIARLLEAAGRTRSLRVALVTGGAGIGKSRLLEAVASGARAAGGTVLAGRAYEAEGERPYGAWHNVLRDGSDAAATAPERFAIPGGAPADTAGGRERLFAAVARTIGEHAGRASPLVLVLDDVQWFDESSAELLHYVLRTHRETPLAAVLAVRDSELAVNPIVARMLAGLRRELGVTAVPLAPLPAAEIGAIARGVRPDADGERIFRESGGNPLFAIEIALAGPAAGAAPATLAQLVRDRLDRLSPEAADVARWAAIAGPEVSIAVLENAVALDVAALAAALEELERHALLRECPAAPGRLEFAQAVVRKVVVEGLSAPRRRLIHRRLAEVLGAMDASEGELARHAALAGDMDVAARACVAAARRCLRAFAGTEALVFACRGLRYADRVEEPDRVRLMLDLADVYLLARRPDDIDGAIARIQPLAERALDFGCMEHAALGFRMLSWLRWEGGDWADAHRDMLQVEAAGRAADPGDRAHAQGETARCPAMLERDLPRAESLLLEAEALARSVGAELHAIHDAAGILSAYRGDWAAAARQFAEARGIALRAGDHMGEYQALLHLTLVAIDTGEWPQAREHATGLARLAERLREGSEAQIATALVALIDYADAVPGAPERLEAAFEALRRVDARHRLAIALNRAAAVALARGDPVRALAWADESQRVVVVLRGRASEAAYAAALALSAAVALGDVTDARARRAAVAKLPHGQLTAYARAAVDVALAASATAVSRRRR